MRFDLIAFDLDGTILRDDGKISEETLTVLREAARKGCVMVPTTGRTLSEIPPELIDASVFHYLILANGASVMDMEEEIEILKGLIPSETAVEAFRKLLGLELPFVAYSEGVAFCDERYMSDLVAFYGPKGKHYAQIIENMRFVASMPDFFAKTGRTVEKIFIHQTPEDKRQAIIDYAEKTSGLSVSESSPKNLEINAADISKGAALEALGSYLGIPRARIMAVGDGANDLTMLAYAGFSVAVANAVPLARDIASYITASNENEGAASAIRKFGLIDG